MLKPANYMSMPRAELLALARKMNDWNANQSMSDAEHNAHYWKEIHPLYQRVAELWTEMLERFDTKRAGV